MVEQVGPKAWLPIVDAARLVECDWRDHGTIVKNICYGRHWKRSSIWGHPLVRLGREITWPDMTSRFVRQIEQQTDCEKPPWQSRRRPPTASRPTSSNA